MDAVESLCRSCGLCCDGTLFEVVRLDATEAASVRRRGLHVLSRESGDVLPQRCEALQGRDCRIYADRPSPCVRFECLLFHARRSGEVAAEEAASVITQTRALVAASDSRAPEHLRRHFLGRAALR